MASVEATEKKKGSTRPGSPIIVCLTSHWLRAWLKKGGSWRKVIIDFLVSKKPHYVIKYFWCCNSKFFEKLPCKNHALGSKLTKNGQKYMLLPQNCILKLLIPTKSNSILGKLASSFIWDKNQ